jgi:putative ABC transport system permease protein
VRTLLRYFSWSHTRRHPVRSILSGIAVALGVSLTVSVDVSRSSAEEAFRKTVLRMSGNAPLQVTRGRHLGVEEAALAKLDAVPGLRAAPVVQANTTTRGEQPASVTVMGLDLIRESVLKRWGDEGTARVNPLSFLGGVGIIVSETFARARALKPGSSVALDTPLGVRRFSVAAVTSGSGIAELFGGNVVVLPVRTVQQLFQKPGRFDRIELLVQGDVEAAAARARAALGPEYTVGPPPQSSAVLDEAMTRLEALMGIGVIALLVGVFITYNSVSICVAERLKEIGTLRALGATKPQIFGALLVEWGLGGFLGSVLGVWIGIVLARVLLRMTAGEVNQVTLVVDVGTLHVLPRTPVLGLLIGTLTSMAGAFFPSRRALRVPPVDLIRQEAMTRAAAERFGATFAVGLASIAAGIALPLLAPALPNAGLASAFLAFLGAGLAMPRISVAASRAVRPLLRRLFRLEGFLAADNLAKAPQRTALTVVALAGALGMLVATSAIIESFKVRGRRWIEEAFPFHVSVNPVDLGSMLYADRPMPEGVRAALGDMEEVDLLYAARAVLLGHGERDIMVLGVEMEGYARMQALHGGQGYVAAGQREALRSGRGVVVSGNYAVLHGTGVGKTLELATRKGPRAFEIVGTYEDYIWPQGAVYLELAVYQELWEDPSVSYLDVRFKPGVPVAEGKRRVEERLRRLGTLFVYDVDQLKAVSDETLDRTLRFANAQVGVAALIGFLGIINTLLISVIGRTREIGLLRAVGMTRPQVGRMILAESLFLAWMGGLLGVALGLLGARGPLLFHVERISGYAMPLSIPWTAIALSLGAALVLGVVGSVLPARRAAQMPLIQALNWE